MTRDKFAITALDTRMSLIDLILNLAGLLLWISWRAVPFDPLVKRRPATLPGTIRPAEPSHVRPWRFLLVLALVLLLRPALYRLIGPSLDWTPAIKLGAISVSFRSDDFWRMAIFSCASFMHVLMLFYLWLLLFSFLTARGPDADVCSQFVRIQLGRVHHWGVCRKISLPFLAALVIWLLAGSLLGAMQLVPPAQSWVHRLEQGIVLGLGTYLVWKYAIGALLGLHLLNTYVYLGAHPFWKFIPTLGQRLLAPLRGLPLLIGRVDFAPVLMIVLVFVAAEFIENGFGPHHKFGLTWLFSRLPL